MSEKKLIALGIDCTPTGSPIPSNSPEFRQTLQPPDLNGPTDSASFHAIEAQRLRAEDWKAVAVRLAKSASIIGTIEVEYLANYREAQAALKDFISLNEKEG